MGYILHITVTSVPADDLAHDLAFKDDQMDILHHLLSNEKRPMLVQMCGTGTSTETAVPPVGDGSMICPLPGHTSLTTQLGSRPLLATLPIVALIFLPRQAHRFWLPTVALY